MGLLDIPLFEGPPFATLVFYAVSIAIFLSFVCTSVLGCILLYIYRRVSAVRDGSNTQICTLPSVTKEDIKVGFLFFLCGERWAPEEVVLRLGTLKRILIKTILGNAALHGAAHGIWMVMMDIFNVYTGIISITLFCWLSWIILFPRRRGMDIPAVVFGIRISKDIRPHREVGSDVDGSHSVDADGGEDEDSDTLFDIDFDAIELPMIVLDEDRESRMDAPPSPVRSTPETGPGEHLIRNAGLAPRTGSFSSYRRRNTEEDHLKKSVRFARNGISKLSSNRQFHSFLDLAEIYFVRIAFYLRYQIIKQMYILCISVRKRPLLFSSGMLFFAISTVFLCFTLQGFCIAEYPFSFSTRFTRYFDEDLCLPGPPCIVYATMGAPNASTNIVINFQVSDPSPNLAPGDPRIPQVCYDERDRAGYPLKSYKQCVRAAVTTISTRDMYRKVYRASLDDLKPGQMVYFRAGVGNISSSTAYSKQYKVKLPYGDQFNFIVGGDVGTSLSANLMTKMAASLSPDFAIIGGDIAYANNMPSCCNIWDRFFVSSMADLVTPDDRLIPVATTIGNHEAGIRVPPRDVHFWFHYFTARYAHDEDDWSIWDYFSPGSEANHGAFRSYYHVELGDDTLLLFLDSGMSASVDGAQLAWMENTLASYQDRRKKRFAIYHVPMYMPKDEYLKTSEIMKELWRPLFVQYGVQVAFEHHIHRYFRYLSSDSDGDILHIGGGAWGVPPSQHRTKGNTVYDKTVYKSHVLYVHTGANSTTISALDRNGAIFDIYTL